MRRSGESSGSARVALVGVSLVRFGLALAGALIRLVVESAGRPDPIELQPHVLQRSGPAVDDLREA
jgi:hypothetical protein